MPRPLRLQYEDVYYHGMNRERWYQRIFHGRPDIRVIPLFYITPDYLQKQGGKRLSAEALPASADWKTEGMDIRGLN